MHTKYLQILKTRWFIAVASLLLGAVIILGIRFFTYKPDTTHYHANFALYVNGQREQFKGMGYYTETTMCTMSTAMMPTERAHMHDNVNNVVHVEDHAVTWGQFFANLGWYMGPDFIESPDGTMYKENGNAKLNVVINDQNYTDLGGVANTVIKDQDKLLVSFGDESDATLQQEYSIIPSTTHHYDVTPDPKSCSGSHDNVTMHDRMVHMF
ncbi:MAG TPA: hypothetical protein VGS08_02495 [Candidatus Saccharimonadales bacterium]|nr:hypothetical protein [Candidatus Saccharimonadales bacterium]